MKKKLEAELISIAHRILKLKNKSELIQLHQEAQKLYEKLTVLLFVEQNFAGSKPTIGQAEVMEKLEEAFDKIEELEAPQSAAAAIETKNVAEEPVKETVINEAEEEPVIAEEKIEKQEDIAIESAAANEENEETESTDDEIAEPELVPMVAQEDETSEETAAENAEEESTPEPIAAETMDFKPAFEWTFEPKEEVKEEIKEEVKAEAPKAAAAQISFEDLLGSSYVDPVFVKPEDIKKEEEFKGPTGDSAFVSASELISNYKSQAEVKSPTLNDRLSKGITIGLNDRMAFIKQLFAGSDEDYNRVLSQLITFDTMEEAQEFIDDMVKPDYHNWDGKDEYSKRFMEIIAKKFS